jgi:2-polyprenyl-6-hydroxyphenyl methylase/3-demethylubiquinone-9 3-methyltransferase
VRSATPDKALELYLEQQSKAYSRTKNAFVARLLGDLAGKRFLDYGCGGGFFVAHAARCGASLVIGTDREPNALATARRHVRSAGLADRVSLVASLEFSFKEKGPIFDVILMKDVIEHAADDVGLLRQARRALAPRGRLTISTQNSWSLNYVIEGGYHRLVKKNRAWFGWDPTHLRFYSPASLGRALRRAGFRVNAWRSVYLIPYKLPRFPGSAKQFTRIDGLSLLDRAVGGVFPFCGLGWNVVVAAEPV